MKSASGGRAIGRSGSDWAARGVVLMTGFGDDKRFGHGASLARRDGLIRSPVSQSVAPGFGTLQGNSSRWVNDTI
jgi:hypothetical protein